MEEIREGVGREQGKGRPRVTTNSMRVCLPQPTHNVLLRRHWVVLLGISGSKTMRQTRNLRVEIWVTEESYRLTLGSGDS